MPRVRSGVAHDVVTRLAVRGAELRHHFANGAVLQRGRRQPEGAGSGAVEEAQAKDSVPVLRHAIVRRVELVPGHVVTQPLESQRDAAPVGLELGAHQTPHVLKEHHPGERRAPAVAIVSRATPEPAL